MLRKSKGPTPEEFWGEVERERGEKVLKYSLAQYLGGMEELGAPRWGLIYVTESSLCFRTFPQRNWFSSILGGGGGAPGRDDEIEFCIVRTEITEARFRKTTSILKKIFAPEPPIIEIDCVDEYHRQTTIRLQIDPGAKEFADLLQATP
ncbi:MAG TPA: hypothetical protein VMW87_15450 [Spirochaetia bacterium]|nr:hypothetical protein [Spirochaetia bacterium]